MILVGDHDRTLVEPLFSNRCPIKQGLNRNPIPYRVKETFAVSTFQKGFQLWVRLVAGRAWDTRRPRRPRRRECRFLLALNFIPLSRFYFEHRGMRATPSGGHPPSTAAESRRGRGRRVSWARPERRELRRHRGKPRGTIGWSSHCAIACRFTDPILRFFSEILVLHHSIFELLGSSDNYTLCFPSASPLFSCRIHIKLVLGYTTLYFVLVLVVLAYAEPSGLPTPSIPVWGQEWPAYIFTIAGILVVMSSGLFVACLRCVKLENGGSASSRGSGPIDLSA